MNWIDWRMKPSNGQLIGQQTVANRLKPLVKKNSIDLNVSAVYAADDVLVRKWPKGSHKKVDSNWA